MVRNRDVLIGALVYAAVIVAFCLVLECHYSGCPW